MQKIWNIKKSDESTKTTLSQALNVHPIIAQLLINRNIVEVEDAKQFLNACEDLLDDPFLFKGMREMVDRINEARDQNETVLIYGDYDVDGVTSSTILTKVLQKISIKNIVNYIPHRMTEGYGLNHEVAAVAQAKGVTLLISVDCGITAVSEVQTLNDVGVDVIIVDHHHPDETLPKAVAIVNPKQEDCPYPFKDMATAGLVTKIAHALLGELPKDVLEFTALGTIADIVPLHGENRIFVKLGLPQIQKTNNKGLMALMDVANIKGKTILPFHIGFVLGPRINAAGRMDSAHKSLDLFLTDDQDEAESLANSLNQCNLQRQKMQREVVDEALAIVEEQFDDDQRKVLVVSKEGWHKGVLGIVASRITDKYYRPSIVISVNEEGVGVASARSVEGFHLHDALSKCSDCLENFGGHKGAAGLTIKQENIDPFRALINRFADQTFEKENLKPTIDIDCDVPLSQVTLDLVNIVESMQPFGEGNPQPVLCSRRLRVIGRVAVLGKGTLKFWVTDGIASISVVGFGMAASYKDIVEEGLPVDIAFNLAIDDWNKAPTPQLMLKDVKLSD